MHGDARLGALLALGLAACVSGEGQSDPLAPTDRFYFPIGIALAKPAGATTSLLVASSNFDLRYSATEGGTLLSVDPTDPLKAPDHGAVIPSGVERIGSYAGQVAAVDARCAAATREEAFVSSRFDGVFYRFGLGADGSLSCDGGCETRFSSFLRDPFAVAVACRAAGPRAYVGFLDTPTASSQYGDGAWIAELDLGSGALRELEVGDGPVRALAYDEGADRLWMASRSSGPRALLHTVLLSDAAWGGASPRDAVESYDLFSALGVRGAELRAVAVGSPPAAAGDPQRLYVTARLYDAEYQDSSGNRPSAEIAGVLVVLDVLDTKSARPTVVVSDVVDVGLGAQDVAVVRRIGKRDAVVVAVTSENKVVVWDDQAGYVAAELGRDPSTGAPDLARSPVALAVDQAGAGAAATIYVAAFDDHDVATFSIADPAKPWAVVEGKRVGGLSP